MGLFKERRRQKFASQLFSEDWLTILHRNVPYFVHLPPEQQNELKRHILVFLSEKHFVGCRALEITDEIRVTIAAQACILLLGRETDYYPHLRTIYVYPEAYVAEAKRMVDGGIVLEGSEIRLGESWRRGSVVLSWDDVQRGAADIHDGHNVVFHEFAHQIDASRGKGDGSDVLRRRSAYIAWARVLHQSFLRHRQDVHSNRRTLMRAYGATNPAEFFAVATEVFFEKAEAMKQKHPALYEQLKNFYHQDPAAIGRQ
jgi:Mlc titration factor MtfA (ptsG expression regulator)